MKLETLRVENCRNIKEAQLQPDEGLTVIAGENGQGKTNLLECIYLLTGGKSFRGSKDMHLVRNGQPFGKVNGKSSNGERESNIEITIEGAESTRRGRFASINGVDYGRATAIAGIFTAVVFEPGHLSLVKSGPEGRRKFLDAALCQLYPGYIGILRRFTRAVTQKNALLKKYYETADANSILDVFDAEIAQSGSEISRRRAEYLAKAGPAAECFYAELSSEAEKMQIIYQPSFNLEEGENGLAKVLEHNRSTDIRAGFCTKGPQREDFEVLLNGESTRMFGSQGQQRSAVLALKLAESETAFKITSQRPVLLLDDVLSELDEGRQSYLLKKMGDGQSFVTTCDATAFSRAAGKVVKVKNGEVFNI